MRAEFSRKTKRAAWERADGRCEGKWRRYGWLADGMRVQSKEIRCNAPLDHGCFHYDHIDPTWTSGRNDLDNCQLLCRQCHKDKTAKDQGDIAKIKRVRDKLIKAKTSKHPMPFGKRSKWKKKFDGSVVRR